MKFLEAAKIVRGFEGGEELAFLLATSGELHSMEIFVKAAAAERGRDARFRTLPFNTLAQALRSEPRAGELELFLLFPWDLLPQADWRSGVPADVERYEDLVSAAVQTCERLRTRQRARLLYVDAPIPPLVSDHRMAEALSGRLRTLAVSLGAEVLPEAFSLEALFEHGLAIATASLALVSRKVVDLAMGAPSDAAKVLVTDFDNTLWRGVVGEVGVAGLDFRSSGLGFPHFVYQTFLRKLRRSGVLLAGVTKNDPDLAVAPLQEPDSVLRPEDFVSIVASYSPKSAQIAELAQHLNLGLDAFVFVDDNPVEIAEVGRALPTVRLVDFPSSVSGLPELLTALARMFHRETVTAEDQDRTEMYRRRLAGMVPKDAEGSDLTDFLRELGMTLTIRDRTDGGRDRAVQLINKTNQFNLNGLRRSDREVAELLSAGGRLYTAALSDKHGDHGEVLAFLIDAEGIVRSFVMSCRVFQRRVEHAFLAWLAARRSEPVRFEFVETERNEPIRRFLRDPAFSECEGVWICALSDLAARSQESLSLFEVRDGIAHHASASVEAS